MTKVSNLTDGGNLGVDDELFVARSSTSRKIKGNKYVSIIARQGPVVVDNTASEITIATATVPANQMGTTGLVEWRLGGFLGDLFDGTKTLRLRIYFGGVVLFDDVHLASLPGIPFDLSYKIQSNASATAQISYGYMLMPRANLTTVGLGDLGATSASRPVGIIGNNGSTIDTTVNQTFAITVTPSEALATLGLTSAGGVLLRY